MLNYHLQEFKYRFWMTINSLILVIIITFLFIPDLMLLFNYNLIAFSLDTTILSIVYFTLINSININLPFIIVQKYLFFKPSLFQIENYIFKIIIFWFLFIWLLGFIFLPHIFVFLLDFNNESILFLPTIKEIIKLIIEIFIFWIIISLTPVFIHLGIKRKIIWLIINFLALLIIDTYIYILLIINLILIIEFNFLFCNLVKNLD